MRTSATVRAWVLLLTGVIEAACNGSGNGGGNGGDAGGSGGAAGATTGDAGGVGGSGGGAGGAAASGGAGGSSAFTPATPPSDVCALLTLSDVQAVLPNAGPGVEQPTGDNSALGFWARDCKWQISSSAVALELVVFGALNESGLQAIKLAAQSGPVNNPVSGVGEEAHYWEDQTNNTNGLWALKTPYSVDTTAYFFKTFPTADQLKPLVVKALGELK